MCIRDRSLGGGNHFIEIAQGTEDAFLCIHSGSRNFGLKIAERYQKIAVALSLIHILAGLLSLVATTTRDGASRRRSPSRGQ